MRTILNCMIVFLVTSSLINGQINVSVKKSEFGKEKEGLGEAWKHVKKGDGYFSDAGVWYGAAFNEYVQAIVYNNSNAELNYKAGVSALMSDKREEAAGFLLKAIELKPDVAEDVKYMAARSLQYDEKFSDAISLYNDYIASAGKKASGKVKEAGKYIEECNSALILINDTLNVFIENAGTAINSSDDEYSEVISADGKTIYFASRRKQKGSGRRNSDSKFDENIFMSVYNGTAWDTAVSAGKDLNTKFCETPVYITPEGDRMYVYAGYENEGDIMVSVNRKGKWRSPVKVTIPLNSNGSQTSFCISSSGEEIYFVSESGKGNIGGKDIYSIKKLNRRKWSKPANAGTVVNTAFDEESVRLSAGGDTLWFSSKGHNSIGGYDIFYSVKNMAGEWDTVKNIGYPVNTPWDEVFFNPSTAEGKSFFFASNRKGGMGGLDIYKGKILPAKILMPTNDPVQEMVAIDKAEVIENSDPVPESNKEELENNIPLQEAKAVESTDQVQDVQVLQKGDEPSVTVTNPEL